ncbi:MAG: hypothetical protein AB1421_15755 [Pseudomonadota bacterium]
MVVAFLVSPLVSGVLHAIHVGNIWAGLFALLFAYPITVLFGVPALLFFIKRRWLHLWQAALGGAILGLMASLILFLLLGLAPVQIISDPSSPYFEVLFLVHGVAIACVLWLFTLRTHDF